MNKYMSPREQEQFRKDLRSEWRIETGLFTFLSFLMGALLMLVVQLH